MSFADRSDPIEREKPVMRRFIIAIALAAALITPVAFAQKPSQDTASIPDFSGTWGHPYVPAFEPLESGPVPVVNKSRRRQVLNVDGNPIAPGVVAPIASTPLDDPEASGGGSCKAVR
jgi:hypothetical protein